MTDQGTDRKARLVRNGIYSAVSWVLPLVLVFAVTPIIVRGLGNEMYGLYAVILGFISYSFTFGIGKTATKFVSEFRAAGEHEKISEAVSAILWLSLAFGLGGSLVIGLLARPIVAQVLLIPLQLRDEAVVALYLACAVIVVTMVSQVFQCVLQGLHRFDRYLLLTNLSGLLLNLGSVAFVYLGYGIDALLIWNFIVTVAIAAIFCLNAKQMMPDLSIGINISAEIRRPVLKYALSIVVYQIFGNLLFLFERGWIVRRFGPEALTYYVVPMMLGIYLHLFVGSLVMALFPVVNELLSDRDKLLRLYQTASKVVLTLIAIFVVTFVIEGRVFLSLWMSEEFAVVSYSILVLHLVTFGTLSMITIVWQVTESFHEARINAFVTFLWMVLAVPLMIMLSEAYGIFGVAIARLSGVLVFIGLIIYVERRFLGGCQLAFWVRTLARIAAAVACAGLAELGVLAAAGSSWTAFLIAAAAGSTVFGLVLFFSGFLNNEEKAIISRFMRRGQQNAA